MSWGLNASLTKASIDQFLGARFQILKSTLEDINDFNNQFLAPIGSAGLQAAPYSYTTTDANQIVSAVGDAVNLYNVYNQGASVAVNGTITVSAGTGHAFDAFIKLGAGLGPHS